MKISIPNLSLVVLVGPSGSGKSTFAQKHFLRTEVLSSDYCRGLVSDDENEQAATKDAFEVLHYIAAKRLAAARLTVVDATNVQVEARRPLVKLAREYHVLPVAIVLNLPEKLCTERNRNRPDRTFGPHVIRQQRSQLRQSLRKLKREGFRHVFVLQSPEEVEAATIKRVPLWNDKRDEHGPFDIIGDVHDLTDRGGEGMVVKPMDFITTGNKGLNQPAVKCRGREYLRIIYGPDYDTETNLNRLRNRHLGRKRSLAIREFALGIEALERFVRREPLRRVHECVFGVLALESEPVDPRL